MSWPVVALVLGVAAALILAYLAWATIDLERAQDKRAALRLEMEERCVATFKAAIDGLQADVKRLQLEQRAQAVRR